MSIKSILAHPFARLSVALSKRNTNAPLDAQKQVFRELIASARDTAFGRDHDFSGIRTYEDFKSRVPIRDYEELKPYV